MSPAQALQRGTVEYGLFAYVDGGKTHADRMLFCIEGQGQDDKKTHGPRDARRRRRRGRRHARARPEGTSWACSCELQTGDDYLQFDREQATQLRDTIDRFLAFDRDDERKEIAAVVGAVAGSRSLRRPRLTLASAEVAAPAARKLTINASSGRRC
jgi:hypothetical protein